MECSLDVGAPVELYEFVQGLQRWFYVSGAEPITRLGQVYQPAPLVRDRIKQSTDVFKDGLKITFPRSDAFAGQFIQQTPDEITTVTVYRGHYGDGDGEYTVYWKGRVIGATATENRIDIECESVFTSIRRAGLRARFEYLCRHAIYSHGCGVNRELYRTPVQVNAVIGLDVVVVGIQGVADGYFNGGVLVIPGGTSRLITRHAADKVTLSRPIDSLSGGMDVWLYPGCDMAKETCQNKFNNLDNFGGFPWIPTRNPFDGSSII